MPFLKTALKVTNAPPLNPPDHWLDHVGAEFRVAAEGLVDPTETLTRLAPITSTLETLAVGLEAFWTP